MFFHRGRFVSFSFFFIILLLIMLYTGFLFSGFDFTSFLPVLFYGVVIVISYFSLIYQINKIYKTDVSINSPYEAVINSNGVNTISSKGDTRYEWKDLYGYKIKEDVIYIFYSQIKALILPMRFFESDKQREEVIVLIKQIDNKKFENSIRRRMWLRVLIYLGFLAFLFCMIGGAFWS